MTVRRQDWELSKRGLKDASRHRAKVKDAIQKNIAEIVSEASIITRKKGQFIKVPIRGLKSYRFLYKRESAGGMGVGQGDAEPGDLIGRQPTGDSQPGQPGDVPGVDYLETEIDIDELIEMLLKDLGLPNLRKKGVAEIEIPKGWRFDSIARRGPAYYLDKKRTVKEAVRRTAAFVGELMRRTGESEDKCSKALILARGDLLLAEKLLREGALPDEAQEPSVTLFSEDLRFRTLKQDVEVESNAAVLAMMDVSGSMGTMKKYLARSFFFWLVEFLRKRYSNVEIRFIAHTTEAKLVDEETFFHKGESGGTLCHSAYDLALHLVESEYSPSRWNVYPFHFSDGEDFEPLKTMASARRLMQMGINMLGYGEIQTDSYGGSVLMTAFARELRLEPQRSGSADFEFFTGSSQEVPFLGAILKEKPHVYLALREFLRKERAL
ncbi:MAG: DUF444 family protein [bacterium]